MEAFKIKNGLQAGRYLGSNGVETAGSVGYDLAGASYDSVSFSVSSQDANPTGVAFSSDGTKMYITGNTNDNVFQYTLSTAFDISTASYDSVSLSVTPQTTVAISLTFKPDGSVLYVAGTTAVYQYTLTTNYDLSTASYASKSLTVSGQENSNQGVALSADGTKVYIVGTTNDTVYQYTLSTAWDLSTGSYASKSLSVTSQDTQPRGLTLNNDGTKIYVLGQTGGAVFQYTLSTAYDISTGSYDSVTFSVSSQEGTPNGLVFGDNGTKLYVVGITNDSIYQYSTVA
jgi:DNA-binding beta-propeller fold protein YncE